LIFDRRALKRDHVLEADDPASDHAGVEVDRGFAKVTLVLHRDYSAS
jgi:hypothetical protein